MIKIRGLFTGMLCLLFATQLTAQGLSDSDNTAIDKKVGQFLDLMEARNYTQTLDFIYPKFFDHYAKKDIFQVFELLEKSGIELKFNNLEILEKQQLPKEGNIEYTLIKYSLNMELPLNTDELKSYAAFMVPMLKSNFGNGNVEHNREENYIKVRGEKYLMGVKDPGYSEWMFLIYDDSFMTAINKTIPAPVSKAAAALAK